jgi:hypothetical protein
VAAIFPEQFQSFTDALKNHIFYKLLCAKPSQLVAVGLTKTNRDIAAKMNQQEALKAVILSGHLAGRTRRKIMSYEDRKQSPDNKVFEGILSLWEDLLICL